LVDNLIFLAASQADLLPVGHYDVVFTRPAPIGQIANAKVGENIGGG
jgi:hypothetical protein